MPILLESPIIGLAGGFPDRIAIGTGLARPGGIEYLIEYGGITFNNMENIDKIRVTEIGGLDDADVRDAREVNPSYHGETAFDAWYGGRTITLTGRIEAYSLEKMRDMQVALRQAFSVLEEQPLIFRSRDGNRDTFLNARKSAPMAMRESQTDMRFFRDFLITLRASNPRFLDYLRRVDQQDIGATLTNYVTNPSIESDTTDWSAVGTNTTIARSTADELYGAASLLITQPTAAGSINWGSQYLHPVGATRVEAGEHTASIWIKGAGTGNGQKLLLYLTELDAGGAAIGSNSIEFTLSNIWQRVTITRNFIAGNRRFRTSILGAGNYAWSAYVDGVMLTKGDVAPDFADTNIVPYSGQTALRPVNYGNFRSQPLIRFTGGLTNPKITNLTSNETVRLAGVISEGSYIDVDIERRTIHDNAGVNRFDLLDMSSDWLELEPGENSIEFDADDSEISSSLAMFYRSSWM
jgi:phage-related protein